MTLDEFLAEQQAILSEIRKYYAESSQSSGAEFFPQEMLADQWDEQLEVFLLDCDNLATDEDHPATPGEDQSPFGQIND